MKLKLSEHEIQSAWKPVNGYEGRYEISDRGEIRFCFSWARAKKGELKKTSELNGGYTMVLLCSHGSEKGLLVHRLVAQAFIPNPEKKPQVNHKNSVRSDNRVENLEWVTRSENTIHASKKGRLLGTPKLTEFEVRDIKKRFLDGQTLLQVWRVYASVVGKSTLCEIRKGRTWHRVQL